MTGLGANTEVKEEGIVVWNFIDDYGIKQSVPVKEYLVPTSKVRLFSTHDYFKKEGKGSFTMNSEGCKFPFISGRSLTFTYDESTHLPIEMISSLPKTGSEYLYLLI